MTYVHKGLGLLCPVYTKTLYLTFKPSVAYSLVQVRFGTISIKGNRVFPSTRAVAQEKNKKKNTNKTEKVRNFSRWRLLVFSFAAGLPLI